MYKELINAIDGKMYNCIAHVHTHPYIGGTCRYFSNQDLRMLETLQKDFQSENGEKKYFFGGLLTVSPENTADSDEISFVFWDENNGWYKITNITAYLNNKEISFERSAGKPKMRLQHLK